MTRITALIGAAALVIATGTASAGPVSLYAYNAKGTQTKAGKHGKRTRIYSADELKKLKPSTRKRYRVAMTICDKPYSLRTAQKRWIAAHKKAKHKIVARERVRKGKYKAVCTL